MMRSRDLGFTKRHKRKREKDRGQTYMAALSGEDPTKTRWKAKETTTVASSWQRSTTASSYEKYQW